MSLQLYSIFHLNLAYSAISEDDRSLVLRQCYWPLLELASDLGVPLGIELSGYTLETIDSLDSNWLAQFKALLTAGQCELIGSGYAQIIGPLLPPDLTRANLAAGMTVYRQLLDLTPNIALINEQAYSAGLISLYHEAGYSGLVMEWNNPASEHSEWEDDLQFRPTAATDGRGFALPLLWNQSTMFQKFQRYAHGELSATEFLDVLKSHRSPEEHRALSLYGNDAETFDFRPGRYMSEASIHADGEWCRIGKLFKSIQSDPSYDLRLPSQVLEAWKDAPMAEPVQLESAARPIPVKKQNKYNVVRWGVSGRNDLDINTRCWRIYSALKQSTSVSETEWKELCYLWSSDFRTHITESRWQAYLERLSNMERQWCSPSISVGSSRDLESQSPNEAATRADQKFASLGEMQIKKKGRFLTVTGKRLVASFNLERGLALEAYSDLEVWPSPLIGTLHQGSYQNIGWSADFYSCLLVYEVPARQKLTDLNKVEPEINELNGKLQLSCQMSTPMGPLTKIWLIDENERCLHLSFQLEFLDPSTGSLRLGHTTLIPSAFEPSSLFYRCHNGGVQPETFSLSGEQFDHGQPVSFLVSASSAVGLTDGFFEIGDKNKFIRVTIDKSQAALLGMVTHSPVDDSFFTRFALTAREMDDTSKPAPLGSRTIDIKYSAHLQ